MAANAAQKPTCIEVFIGSPPGVVIRLLYRS